MHQVFEEPEKSQISTSQNTSTWHQAKEPPSKPNGILVLCRNPGPPRLVHIIGECFATSPVYMGGSSRPQMRWKVLSLGHGRLSFQNGNLQKSEAFSFMVNCNTCEFAKLQISEERNDELGHQAIGRFCGRNFSRFVRRMVAKSYQGKSGRGSPPWAGRPKPKASCPLEEGGRLEKGVPLSSARHRRDMKRQFTE